jgi:two-component system sensor histidine kinase KdpD
VRTHATGGPGGAPADTDPYHARIELDGERLGTIVALRPRGAEPPDRAATRVLALAADQLATSLRRDQLRRAATELEVAREADDLKTALIDAVSHDLRTPLASIRATAGGLADPEVAWTDDERRRAGAVIDAEATRLDRLVSGLLDLGRIASGNVHPSLEPHEPWALIEPVVERLRPALEGRRFDVRVPADLPPSLVDAGFVDVVLTNLLDNAIRHAPAPAPIAIDARADGDRIRITVSDGGPGVADADLPRLFDRFWRSAGGTRPGMGIGLSVVRGLVEAMGGTVRAERAELGGLSVEVALQRAPDAG